jgi:hypothetical protein
MGGRVTVYGIDVSSAQGDLTDGSQCAHVTCRP